MVLRLNWTSKVDKNRDGERREAVLRDGRIQLCVSLSENLIYDSNLPRLLVGGKSIPPCRGVGRAGDDVVGWASDLGSQRKPYMYI